MIAVEELDVREQLLDRRRRLVSFADDLPEPAAARGEIDGLLQLVDEALARLETSTYGICTGCHDPVELERLATDPLVSVCLSCLTPAQSDALERDLETAVKIQSRLLPDPDWCHGGWEMHYRYQPLGPVSGDHIDLVRADPISRTTYFLFGDVSGKGIAASLLMSNLQALFRSLIHLGLPLREVVERVNRLFVESTHANAYATLVAGRVHDSGEVEIANAGHLSPFVVRSGSVTPIASTGLPVGMFAQSKYRVHTLTLHPDDYLLLYTDGITEAENGSGDEYGAERVASELSDLRGRSARTAVETALAKLDGFLDESSVSDDLTVMAIRRVGRVGEARVDEVMVEDVANEPPFEIEVRSETAAAGSARD